MALVSALIDNWGVGSLKQKQLERLGQVCFEDMLVMGED